MIPNQEIINDIHEVFRKRGWHNKSLGIYKDNKIIIYKDYFYGTNQPHKNRISIVKYWENKKNTYYENWFCIMITPIIKKYNLEFTNFIFQENYQTP